MDAEPTIDQMINHCLDTLWQYKFGGVTEGMFELLEHSFLIANGDSERLMPLLDYLDGFVAEVFEHQS